MGLGIGTGSLCCSSCATMTALKLSMMTRLESMLAASPPAPPLAAAAAAAAAAAPRRASSAEARGSVAAPADGGPAYASSTW